MPTFLFDIFKRSRMSWLFRQSGFRCLLVIVLMAPLFAALFLPTGDLTALLAGAFVFFFLLTAGNGPLKEVRAEDSMDPYR